MSQQAGAKVNISTVAEFPDHFFLENLAARADNSLLVTVANRNELHHVPAAVAGEAVRPNLLHTFSEMAMGILEVAADVFVVLTTNGYTTHECYMHKLDLRGWASGAKVTPETILTFPKAARAVNGCCVLSPGTLLVADCFAGLIWRVELDAQVRATSCEVWLEHPSMAYVDAHLPPPPQPGINGIRYSQAQRSVFYTTTGQKRFTRVGVDPATLAPAGEPESVAGGGMYDDLCLDDERRLAYVTVHRENRIDRLPLEPGAPAMQPLAGDPIDERLLGPSSAVWSRAPGEAGRVIFVTTDGGHTAPPPGIGARRAKVLRLELTQPG